MKYESWVIGRRTTLVSCTSEFSYTLLDFGSDEEDFLKLFFFYIWVLRPCWSYDPDDLNNISLSQALEPIYEILLQ